MLNKGEMGTTRRSQMPGAVGNFTVASHRTATASLNQISSLRVGDHIYVETADGWYPYAFRNLEYVCPPASASSHPLPQAEACDRDDRIITSPSCNPLFSTAERIMAYGAFDAFYPTAGGPPAEIAATVNGKS